MSRTEINVATNSTNGDSVITATDLAQGATGTSGYVIEDSTRDERLGLIVENTGSATGIITIEASDGFESASLGDMEITVGGSVKKLVGPLDGSRFRQTTTGYINIGSGITGSIYAVEV
jgi:hypothetical protein